jgi:hypothetical protein
VVIYPLAPITRFFEIQVEQLYYSTSAISEARELGEQVGFRDFQRAEIFMPEEILFSNGLQWQDYDYWEVHELG